MDELLLRITSRSKLQTNGCIIWQGAKTLDGYGQIWDGRQVGRVHRIVYELTFGPMPKDRYVCHICDTPACINPMHLFLGTQYDNMNDMYNKGREPNQIGVKNPNAKLTFEQVQQIRADVKKGFTKASLARLYNVSPSCINSIATQRNWRE